MTNNEQKLLDEILDYFNFHKVASIMEHLQWTWVFCDSPGGIPTECDLRAKVREQFTRLIAERRCMERFVCATGGFEYVVWRDTDGNVDVLELKFVVSDWGTAG